MDLPQRPILGIKLIDDEHLDILMFMSQIKTNPDNGVKIAYTMMKYVLSHFGHEELFMSRQKYPAAEYCAHIFEHKRMSTAIKKAIDDSEYNLDPKTVERFRVEFLTHIAIYDQLWADWYNEQRRIADSKQST